MCFEVLMLLAHEVDLRELAMELEREGYEVSLRGGALEAISPRGIPVEFNLRGRELYVRTPDVGDRCVFELDELNKLLRPLDPRVVLIRGRILHAIEKSRGSTKELAKRLGLSVEREHSGYCG